MTWKLKKDEETGNVVLGDKGHPIYIDPDGKELQLDGPDMYAKIIDLGKENEKRRKKAKEIESKYVKIFEGVEDLEEWKKKADEAIEKVESFNDKDWMDVKKVDELKAEMKTSYETKIQNTMKAFSEKESEFQNVLSKKDTQMRKLMITNLFSTDPHFSGKNPKTTLPPVIAESYFGQHFKVEETENGDEVKLVAYNDKGDIIRSREKPGEVADLKEAMATIIELSPYRDQIMRSTGGGSGASGGSEDDPSPSDKLGILRKQHKEALEAKDGKTAIILRRQISLLENQVRK